MANFMAMSDENALRELRCEANAQHRLEAAKYLLDKSENPERIAYLVNCVLYDPLPEVKTQVKSLLHEVYGNELESIIKIEGQDGTPIENPWMVPCSLVKTNLKKAANLPYLDDIEALVAAKDVEGLHDTLRDPLDVIHRLVAIQALLKCNNEATPEMLARAVLHDPDENVQQQAYQALYKLIGDDKAEALLEKIGTLMMDEDEKWLLTPDYFDEYQHSLEQNDQDISPFGINKADQIRGLINLFTNERNSQRRMAIIDALAQSNDFNANDAIARVGLFDADKSVREYAKSVLENRLGENLEEFLEHVYATASPFVADPEDESDEDEVEEPPKKYDDFSSKISQQEPVVSEGSTFNPIIIISGLVCLVLVLFLIFRW